MTRTTNIASLLALTLLAWTGVATADTAAATPAGPAAQLAPGTAAQIDALLATAMAGKAVPAMGATLIRAGKPVATAVKGQRAADQPDPVQAGDVWHLGSNGKAMTATLIARLVEKGQLSWEAPLSALLPALAAEMQPGYRDVTLRDLLAHQAGLHENIAEDAAEPFFTDTRPITEQRAAYAKLALAQLPKYARGTADGYSNNGPLIAAAVAERVTGVSYEQLMRREVFEPLGINSAGFGATRRGQPLGHLAGKPKEGTRADNVAALAPAGGISMSLGDWSRFAIDQMQGAQGRGKLLKSASYTILHDAARTGGKFALGWRRQASMAEVSGPFLSHSGSNEFWFAIIALRPGTEDGVLVVANAGPDGGAQAAAAQVVKTLVKGFAPAQ